MTTHLKDLVETSLFGNSSGPSNLVDEALIGSPSRGALDIDITTHMNNEGRFVTASQFSIVESFFGDKLDLISSFADEQVNEISFDQEKVKATFNNHEEALVLLFFNGKNRLSGGVSVD